MKQLVVEERNLDKELQELIQYEGDNWLNGKIDTISVHGTRGGECQNYIKKYAFFHIQLTKLKSDEYLISKKRVLRVQIKIRYWI